MSGARGMTAAQVAVDFLTAVRDERINDLLALVDPEIVCRPLVRPGRSRYEGHEGMVRFVSDIHAVFGRYQFEIDKIDETDETKVTLWARIFPESGRTTLPPLSAAIAFVLRDGLITSTEGDPGGQRE